MNIATLQQNLDLCEWLIENGLDLEECAFLIGDLECGDTFPLALLKVFKNRKERKEVKYPVPSWDNPLIP